MALLLLAGAADLVPTSMVIALARAPVPRSPGCDSPGWPPGAAPTRPSAAGMLLDAAVVAAGLTAVVLPLADLGTPRRARRFAGRGDPLRAQLRRLPAVRGRRPVSGCGGSSS
ncbi:hypothetical protein NKG94_26475 [Micromonospora sp. M12]